MIRKEKINSSTLPDINLGHSVIIQRADGIIEIDCCDNFEYEVEHIQENYNQIKKLVGTKKVLILSVTKPFTTTTKDVRDFIASAPHRAFVKAEAFLIHTLGQTIMGNFFLKVNKPIVPAKFFKSKTEAEKWLKSFE
ncbi:MAG: hypothetical protein NT084_05620 [Bacteroidetes bacterium]|jgi:hypothetical protein|nr:hypothetical protein [Bacteroidota bacterium]